MTVLCQEEYQEFTTYLARYRERMAKHEIDLIELALNTGRDEVPIPDGLATQCRCIIHRVWLELYAEEGSHGDRRVPYPNRWIFEK